MNSVSLVLFLFARKNNNMTLNILVEVNMKSYMVSLFEGMMAMTKQRNVKQDCQFIFFKKTGLKTK